MRNFVRRSKDTIWVGELKLDSDGFPLFRYFFHKKNRLYGIYDFVGLGEHVVSNAESRKLDERYNLGFVPYEQDPVYIWPKEDGEFYQRC